MNLCTSFALSTQIARPGAPGVGITMNAVGFPASGEFHPCSSSPSFAAITTSPAALSAPKIDW